MELNYFDLVVGIIILLLGLKGIINGFFKELFGLVGIIGGIAVASRMGDKVGKILSDALLKLPNDAAISFTGFLATLAAFWLAMVFIGFVFKKLSSMSGLGPVDRLFGFIFGASKFFLIVAIIANAVYNVKAIKSTVDSKTKGSILFPILVETGGYIMELKPVDSMKKEDATSESNNSTTTSAIMDETKNLHDKIEETTQNIVEDTKKQIEENVKQSTQEILEDTKKKLEESMQKQMGEE